MERIIMAHGSGGRLSQKLIAEVFQHSLCNTYLSQMNDATIVPGAGQLAITTDSFVISPIFFRGGDIGKLAVCGTINDLAVSGAIGQYLSLGIILEEGFLIEDLKRIVHSISETAENTGVKVVCGDTKVVEKGSVDRVFINTTGVGFITNRKTGPEYIKPGDAIIVSGTIGDHGIAIMAEREGLEFETPVLSDCAPLNGLVDTFFTTGVRCMRDPTRGGVATTLNELAKQANVGIVIQEDKLPVHYEVEGACGMLGLDPLYLANEGKVIVFVAPEEAEAVLMKMHSHPLGKEATIIGEVIDYAPGMVLLETNLGGKRMIGMLEGEHLPRIC